MGMHVSDMTNHVTHTVWVLHQECIQLDGSFWGVKLSICTLCRRNLGQIEPFIVL